MRKWLVILILVAFMVTGCSAISDSVKYQAEVQKEAAVAYKEMANKILEKWEPTTAIIELEVADGQELRVSGISKLVVRQVNPLPGFLSGSRGGFDLKEFTRWKPAIPGERLMNTGITALGNAAILWIGAQGAVDLADAVGRHAGHNVTVGGDYAGGDLTKSGGDMITVGDGTYIGGNDIDNSYNTTSTSTTNQ